MGGLPVTAPALPSLRPDHFMQVAALAVAADRRNAASAADAARLEAVVDGLATDLRDRLADLVSDLELAIERLDGGSEESVARLSEAEQEEADALWERLRTWQGYVSRAVDGLEELAGRTYRPANAAEALRRLYVIPLAL